MIETTIVLDNRRLNAIILIVISLISLLVSIPFSILKNQEGDSIESIIIFISVIQFTLILITIIGIYITRGFNPKYVIVLKEEVIHAKHIKNRFNKKYPPNSQLESVHYVDDTIKKGLIILSPTVEYFIPGVPKKGDESKLEEFIDLANIYIQNANKKNLDQSIPHCPAHPLPSEE